MRHRHLVVAPLLVLLLATVVGGQLNAIDARGRVIDDSTDLPVAGVSITYGANRAAVSADDGSYEIKDLPRGARLRTRAPGYQPENVAAEATQIRLHPGTLSLQVNEESNPEQHVAGVEVRQGDKLLAKCAADPCGQLTIATIDVVGQKALVCAPDHESKEIELRGVTKYLTLARQTGGGCPALLPPSPAPSPSPSARPTATASPSTTP